MLAEERASDGKSGGNASEALRAALWRVPELIAWASPAALMVAPSIPLPPLPLRLFLEQGDSSSAAEAVTVSPRSTCPAATAPAERSMVAVTRRDGLAAPCKRHATSSSCSLTVRVTEPKCNDDDEEEEEEEEDDDDTVGRSESFWGCRDLLPGRFSTSGTRPERKLSRNGALARPLKDAEGKTDADDDDNPGSRSCEARCWLKSCAWCAAIASRSSAVTAVRTFEIRRHIIEVKTTAKTRAHKVASEISQNKTLRDATNVNFLLIKYIVNKDIKRRNKNNHEQGRPVP